MIVVWLQDALDDLDRNIDYIAERNPSAAVDQDELITDQVSAHANFPEMGRTGRMKTTRELVIQGTAFIAVYRVKKRYKIVEVIRLLHGNQQWP
ncbi:type II toxin-antitoxin system mRNA interferase toxin, RelE/StbE family [Asticcacaulis excentricus]|uniref:Addiction module toxin, RelE/StbE family n=1 Tax=Asticcacaulis excentricus (strain ATCC 15261 / DSM 4724 / KCTC 12464 / NCIMB 9791 / VKM B-1370 / CB 48) TaxID=573065 RepID=E8RM82_ASTEC|nr:type II toxin-antitoxin system mRNA interferase toxin, RelE/StbE family [Asticcacaulis excentricus]ADU13833.1 addiction module toxin, RelE/StbE family [Asticcacaulis excentricus CB 48]